MVGTSGSDSIRSVDAIASARSLPDLTCSAATGYGMRADVTCAPKIALAAGAAPEYGTKMISTVATRLSFRDHGHMMAPGRARMALGAFRIDARHLWAVGDRKFAQCHFSMSMAAEAT